MIDVLLDRPQPLRIDNADIDDLILLIFEDEGSPPDPNALGFGVGGGPNCEPGLLFEDDGVEEVRFAGAVHAGNRNYGYFALDRLEELDCVWVHLIL